MSKRCSILRLGQPLGQASLRPNSIDRSRRLMSAVRAAFPTLIQEVRPLYHLLPEIENPAVNHEGAISIVMDRPTFLASRIDPSLHRFEDEEVVLANQADVRDSTFDVGKTLGNERRIHFFGWHRRQAEGVELVDILA